MRGGFAARAGALGGAGVRRACDGRGESRRAGRAVGVAARCGCGRGAEGADRLAWGLAYVFAELAASLVLSGEADAIRQTVRLEIEAREAIARSCFAGLEFTSHKRAPFLWMKLPEPWMSGTFKHAAASEGVLIDDEDEYKPGRTENIYHRIRVGFSAPSRDGCRGGFATIRRLLDNGNAGYDSYG